MFGLDWVDLVFDLMILIEFLLNKKGMNKTNLRCITNIYINNKNDDGRFNFN